MDSEDLQQAVPVADADEAHRQKWRREIVRERWRWASSNPCPECGEWIGHWGGGQGREECSLVPMNVPLEEVRPNCFTVLRHWFGDAVRAACERRAAGA